MVRPFRPSLRPEEVRQGLERILTVLDMGAERALRVHALVVLSTGFERLEPVVWSTFCAQPLSSMGEGFRYVPEGVRFENPRLRAFFERISRVQPYAYALHHAWEWVPEAYFRPPWERSKVSILLGSYAEHAAAFLEEGPTPEARADLVENLLAALEEHQIHRARDILTCWLDRAVDLYLQHGAPA